MFSYEDWVLDTMCDGPMEVTSHVYCAKMKYARRRKWPCYIRSRSVLQYYIGNISIPRISFA